ncbi:zinc finger protein 277-like protein [Sarcoptes scabiei]|uniref:Zinc finger protein 277-like protein n=1 Tax=Sarcoptes scabiei TaxID=52283 RepID=A0A132A026_SARSC|nr:zinc finger protein 277-like protein [Sarcoptes scabiei]
MAQDERENKKFDRMCLFCKKTFTENRSNLFQHLRVDHNFLIGHPDNIIDSNALLDLLEERLKNLLCLYCERTFKSWEVLKEHMRKKGHKLLNPNNPIYDRFYLINYSCKDKNWIDIKKENDLYINDCSDDDWQDWIDDDKLDCLCFFCPKQHRFSQLKKHLLKEHLFDFNKIYSYENFYDRIKFVNFIRKCSFTNQCFYCQEQYENRNILNHHLRDTSHSSLMPMKDSFQSPEYYFSTLDDDYILLFLDKIDDNFTD